MEKKKRYFLAEEDIPRYWYNIQADMVNNPMPPLNPAKQINGSRFPRKCAKCTNTTGAHRS